MGAVLRLLSSIVPSSVVVVETGSDIQGHLYPAEQDYIARAVRKRRAEFTTVRYCAERALGALGYARPVQIPGPRGEPAWPQGVVGSMTHCAGYRAVAVALDTAVDAIGIDAEPNAPLSDDVLRLVASSEEARRCALLSAQHPGVHFDCLLFSIKESMYKAWFPREGVWLGFEDADVTIDPEGAFGVIVRTPEVGHAWYAGRWNCVDGILASSLVVPIGGWHRTGAPTWSRTAPVAGARPCSTSAGTAVTEHSSEVTGE